MSNVYWITGLSGAGKTTVGTKLYEYLKAKKDNVIRLDGDVLRECFLNHDYSHEGRKELGFQYGRLCRMLSAQDIDVVICTIAMYDEVREWNRANIDGYREIYLEVSIEELIRRDQKGIYSGALRNEVRDVYGVNLEPELPKNPDLIIQNYGEIRPEDALNTIVGFFKL